MPGSTPLPHPAASKSPSTPAAHLPLFLSAQPRRRRHGEIVLEYPGLVAASSTNFETEETPTKALTTLTKNWLLVAVTSFVLLSTALAFDNATLSQFLSYATSDLGSHASLGIVFTAQALAPVVFRPLIVKSSQVFGIATTYAVATALYAGGYAMMAAAPSVGLYAAGSIVSSLATSGFFALVQPILLAYLPDLSKNALYNALYQLPNVIMGWIASIVVQALLENSSWRWGHGMFCIITPVVVIPFIVLRFVDERRLTKDDAREAAEAAATSPSRGGETGASRSSISATRSSRRSTAPFVTLGTASHPSSSRSHSSRHYPTGDAEGPGTFSTRIRQAARAARHYSKKAYDPFAETSVIGFVLFTASLAGLLFPFMLIGQGSMTFSSPLFIGPVVGGVFATALLVWHECKTSHPLFARELLANRQLLVAFAASFLNMLSYFLIFAFQYSYIQVEYQHLDPMIHGFINFSESCALTVAYLAVAYVMKALVRRRTEIKARDEKSLKMLKAPMVMLLVGLVINVGSTGMRVSVAFAGTMYGQIPLHAARSPHEQAMAYSLVSLAGDAGGAIGSTLATFLWKHFLPSRLSAALGSSVSRTELDEIFASVEKATSYASDSAVSLGIREAYAQTMQILVYAALGAAGLSLVGALALGKADVADASEVARLRGRVHGEDGKVEAKKAQGRERRSLGRVESRDEEERYLLWAREGL
ncbi:uncharacterized protein JCM10292_002942 [Rhodotorula paludigena]|uniref:uncharacterized protein n=1 Tax=Rhodotorula paludigena TaxID=86838 RepID=UPI0031734B37